MTSTDTSPADPQDPQLNTYLSFFKYFHRRMVALVQGLPADALNWRPLPAPVKGVGDEDATNSLAALVAHVTGSLRFWVGEVAGGRPAHRDRPAEFRVTAETAEALVARLGEALDGVRDVLANLPTDQLEATVAADERSVTRRWAIVHAIEHAALHAGHMELTRQLWESRSEP